MDRHRTRRLETAALIIALMLFIPTIASALPAPMTIRPAPLPARHTAFTTARPVLQLRSGQTTKPKPARPRTPKRTIERAVAPVTAAPTTATVAVAPAPAPAPVSGTPDWNAIAACESGGNWAANTGNGYWGGLQFHPNTWFAYGGGPFDGSGPFPYSAGQQIAVAEGVYAGQGPGAWPSCFQYA